MKESNEIRKAVLDKYTQIAKDPGCNSSCCRDNEPIDLQTLRIGYSEEELKLAPENSNMALGCGNPRAIAELKEGELVVDLGCGGGFDAFLAAHQVGKTGKVIGVDMSAAMIQKARENAETGNYEQVEFRLGEIEHLPVENDIADVIISNCVINLSPENNKVYSEAFRVLKPKGRLAISDVVSYHELSDEIKNNTKLYTECISGATPVKELKEILELVGFTNIRITKKDGSDDIIKSWEKGIKLADQVFSAYIQAEKPQLDEN